jgi:putative colanic acid biosynthesis UDP-glucose lipid carrier transferase
MRQPFTRLMRGGGSISALVKHMVEPVVAVGVLLLVAVALDEPIDQFYFFLSLITFSLTFPGGWPEGRYWKMANQILVSWVVTFSLLVALGYATDTLSMFSFDVLMVWGIATPILFFLVLVGLKRMVPRLKILFAYKKKAIILGANELGHQLATNVSQDFFRQIEIAGFFDDRNEERLKISEQEKLLGNMGDVAEYVKHNVIDVIYIALPMASQPRVIKLLDDLRDTTVSIYFVPDIFIYDLIQARVDEINGVPIVAVCETPFYGVNGLLKQTSDIVFALLILLLISPAMLLIALGVKFSSSGPILFKQRRYGVDGREIVVYKFRSMTVCEDGQHIQQAQLDDKRVTKLGAFLRRTSLDELPQFINVLEGKMSVVGPRPHAVSHNEMYRKMIKGYMVRHKVKPGITGWAQVNGFRGETETLDKMEKRVQYDLDYLRSWSLTLDAWIILKTVGVVFRDRHAY